MYWVDGGSWSTFLAKMVDPMGFADLPLVLSSGGYSLFVNSTTDMRKNDEDNSNILESISYFVSGSKQ
jgi:hypothetical protein